MSVSSAQKTTIYDVAARAGVSIATVSRTLNGYENVKESTRNQVYAAVKSMQFRPRRSAKALAQRDLRTIGVAVPTYTTLFHNELLKGIRDGLDDQRADLLLCDLDWKRPVSSLHGFLSGGAIDGLVLAGVEETTDLRAEIGALGAPAVIVGGSMEGFDTFGWDDVEGGRKATAHLVEKGYSQIRMITTHHSGPTRDARIEGFKTALLESGVGFEKAWVATGQTNKHAGYSEESGYEAMETLMKRDADVDAVFAGSDVQAIGAWQALQHRGRSVPEDVAILGYDDVKVSRFIGLSSVSQRIRDIGQEATWLLLQRLRGRGPSQPVAQVEVPEVVPRSST